MAALIPLALRATHLITHIITFTLILNGINKLPNPPKKGKLLEAAHSRATTWLLFEIIYIIMAGSMLIASVVNLTLKNPPDAIARIQAWFLDNCPNFSFFYYVMLSLFVLYATMIGFNIPMLFNKVPIYHFPSVNVPTKPWQFILIFAALFGIANSILHFVAAFYPLKRNITAGPVTEGETEKETKAQAMNEDEKKEGQVLDNKQETNSLLENQPDENEVKSLTG